MADTLDGLISFFSSFYAIRAETVLSNAGYAVDLIPGPKELSPNCGVALLFNYGHQEVILKILNEKRVRIDSVHQYRLVTEYDVTQIPTEKENVDSTEKRKKSWLIRW